MNIQWHEHNSRLKCGLKRKPDDVWNLALQLFGQHRPICKYLEIGQNNNVNTLTLHVFLNNFTSHVRQKQRKCRERRECVPSWEKYRHKVEVKPTEVRQVQFGK